MKFFIALLLTLCPAVALGQWSPLEDLHGKNVPLLVPPRFGALYTGTDSLRLPQGFSVQAFQAGSMMRPRFMAFGPDSTLYVADMDGRAILALPDKNKDGIADTVLTVAAPVDTCHSLAFYRGALYVAEPTCVRRFTDPDKDGYYQVADTFISGIHSGGPYDHYTRTLVFDTLNGYVYISVGGSCNACREQYDDRGTVMRYNIDGSGRTVYATGLRNSIGLAIEPRTGRVWSANADRDRLGGDIPPEIITSLTPGGFYGWPFAYADRQWVNFQASPEYTAILPLTAADSQKVAGMQMADVYLTPHITPMAILFYRGDAFPAQYRDMGFLALHGSANKTARPVGTGYQVVRLRWNDTSGKWIVGDFLSGFLTDSLEYKYWGRPCGLVTDAKGDLYVSSDRGIPAIYKITYKKTGPGAVSGSGATSALAHAAVRCLPNTVQPGRGYTDVEYSTPEPGDLRLDAFGADGGWLGRLAQLHADTGTGHYIWRTAGLPSGACFCRITVRTTSGRMLSAWCPVFIND